VQQARQGGPAAGHRDLAPVLACPADATDERAEARRVHERDIGQVDHDARLVRQFPQRITEAGHGVGIELTNRTAERVAVGVVDFDLEHAGASIRVTGANRDGTQDCDDGTPKAVPGPLTWPGTQWSHGPIGR